jgi:hypothetical protein
VATSSETQDADGIDAESAMEIEALRVRLATAERDALEARDETKATRTVADERSAALEAALEAERKKHRHAVETLESVHLDAGVHEAQEMVQLRMALVAAQEELDIAVTGMSINIADQTIYTGSFRLHNDCLNMIADLWHCPADNSRSQHNRRQILRARSVSMNAFVNGTASDEMWANSGVRPVRKASEMTEPGPSMALLFIDERPDSLNNAMFMVSTGNSPTTAAIDNWPSNLHSGSAVMDFADGHAEAHRWLDPRTSPPVKTRTMLQTDTETPSPGNRDVLWLWERTLWRR